MTIAINYIDTRVIKMCLVDIQAEILMTISSVNLCFINIPVLDNILEKIQNKNTYSYYTDSTVMQPSVCKIQHFTKENMWNYISRCDIV